jgi:hypothetical protein
VDFLIFMLSFCGGAAVIFLPLAWLVFRHEALKREMSHAERMRSLEVGIPLPDAQVARFGALRWIGVGVPLAALFAAVAATWFLVPLRESGLFLGMLGSVWVTCGVVCLVALPATLARLGERDTSGIIEIMETAQNHPRRQPSRLVCWRGSPHA